MRKTVIIIALVLFLFLFSAVFFKTISGEDCWIPDGEGGWAKHGAPAGPAPDYPSPTANAGDAPSLLPLFLTGSLLSCLSIYLFLRFSKGQSRQEKVK
jgi:hypothetical protein